MARSFSVSPSHSSGSRSGNSHFVMCRLDVRREDGERQAEQAAARATAYVLETASIVRKHPSKRPSVLSVVHGVVHATSMERCAEGAP